jgi:hypothetical protein
MGPTEWLDRGGRSPRLRCDPPYTEADARVIVWMDHEDDHQTARWSGIGPGRGCIYAPWTDGAQITQTDTMDRPCEMAI